jgi:hypothetical protein
MTSAVAKRMFVASFKTKRSHANSRMKARANGWLFIEHRAPEGVRHL